MPRRQARQGVEAEDDRRKKDNSPNNRFNTELLYVEIAEFLLTRYTPLYIYDKVRPEERGGIMDKNTTIFRTSSSTINAEAP